MEVGGGSETSAARGRRGAAAPVRIRLYLLPLNNITKIAFARKPKCRAHGGEGKVTAYGRPPPGAKKGVDTAAAIC
jgi:hypothetical protein